MVGLTLSEFNLFLRVCADAVIKKALQVPGPTCEMAGFDSHSPSLFPLTLSWDIKHSTVVYASTRVQS